LHDTLTDRTVFVLGFLLDTIDTSTVGSPLVRVESIQDIVSSNANASSWFRTVVQKTTAYDAILVLAHMSIHDPNISLLLSSIRQLTNTNNNNNTVTTTPDAADARLNNMIPVQFITGHTHLIHTKVLDACAVAVESGKYLEAIGLVSFPTKQEVESVHHQHHQNNHNTTSNSKSNSSCLQLFSQEILPANIEVLTQRVNKMKTNTKTTTTVTTTTATATATAATTGTNLMTRRGQQVQKQISTTQQQMGLNRIIGCAPHTYLLNQTLVASNSLFGLWYHSVLQNELQASLTASASASATATSSTSFSSQINTNTITKTKTKTKTNKLAVLQGTRSSFRYDLYKGIITMNDIMIVSPFNDTVYLVQHNLSLPILRQLESYMNDKALQNNKNNDGDGLLVSDFLLLTIPDAADTNEVEEATSNTNNNSNNSSSNVVGSNDDDGYYYDLYTLEYEVPFIHKGLRHILGTTTTTALSQQQPPRPTTVASTSLWIQFIESQWSLSSSSSSSSSSFCQQQYQQHLKQQQQYPHSHGNQQLVAHHQHPPDGSMDHEDASYIYSNKNNVVAVTVATMALLVSILLCCRIVGCRNTRNYNRLKRRRTYK